MSKTPDVGSLVQKLRQKTKDLSLPEEPNILTNEETYIRFLKSRNWDLEVTEKHLRRSVAWRKEFRPFAVQCVTCQSSPGSHTLRQIGFDEAHRPVIWASFYPALPSQRNQTVDAINHLIYTIENAVRSMPPGVTQWVFIIDCAGMTAQTFHPRIGYECAQLMSNHYPERLGLAICLFPGTVFKVAWQAMKPFLPLNTVSKVVMVTSKSQLQHVLDQNFSPSMAKWIDSEQKLNRRKPTRHRYRLFYCPANASTGDHDPRGEVSYVRDWVERAHPSGHRPHPNISDYLSGKIKAPPNSVQSTNGVADDQQDDEEDEMAELDEADVQKLVASLPVEYQIPPDAPKFA